MTYSKAVTHSEDWWEHHAPPHVLRCAGTYKSTGTQCRRVAVDGSVVCGHHGGSASQVIRRAAERVQFTADDAARQLVSMMADPDIEVRERVKIAQDLLDRAGLAAAQVHKVLPIQQDPVEKLLSEVLGASDGLLDPEAEPARALALPAAPTASDELADDEQPGSLSEASLTELRQAADPPPPESAQPPQHIRDALARLL